MGRLSLFALVCSAVHVFSMPMTHPKYTTVGDTIYILVETGSSAVTCTGPIAQFTGVTTEYFPGTCTEQSNVKVAPNCSITCDAYKPLGFGSCVPRTLNSSATFQTLLNMGSFSVNTNSYSPSSLVSLNTTMAYGYGKRLSLSPTTCDRSIMTGPGTSNNQGQVGFSVSYMCSCAAGTVQNISATVTSNTSLPGIPGVSPSTPGGIASAATDRYGNIWFHTYTLSTGGDTSGLVQSHYIASNTLLMSSPPYSASAPTGIADCSYVWSDGTNVFYITTGGSLRKLEFAGNPKGVQVQGSTLMGTMPTDGTIASATKDAYGAILFNTFTQPPTAMPNGPFVYPYTLKTNLYRSIPPYYNTTMFTNITDCLYVWSDDKQVYYFSTTGEIYTL